LAALTSVIEIKKYQLNVGRTININWDSDIKLTSVNISAPAFDVFFNARNVTMKLKTSEV